jgi:hypothetical protein
MKVKNVNLPQGIQNELKGVDLSRVMKRQNLVLRKKRAKVTAFPLRCMKNILHMTQWGRWLSHAAPPCSTTSNIAAKRKSALPCLQHDEPGSNP